MPDFSERDSYVLKAKARPKGTLPYLPDGREPEALRDWLTLACRPDEGWRVSGFERTGRDPRDPCWLQLANGREARTYRFNHQTDLCKDPRITVVSTTDGKLAVPHLTGTEVEDFWVALCQLGTVLTEHDERDETRKWIEQLLPATSVLTGHTLTPEGRHDGLMALKRAGEFTKSDALTYLRPDPVNGSAYLQRPARFVDEKTGDQWVRVGETGTFVRWVVGVEPLSHGTLRARLHEVGVVGRLFEDYRPPHPKLNLYQLTSELIEGLE